MNINHITTRIGTAAALAAGTMLIAPALGVAASNQPVPDRIPCDTYGIEWDCEPRPPQGTAIGVARRFVEARDGWDGEMVRSLVADDAVIDDFAVAAVDDYLANAEFEQVTGWRYLERECSATQAGPPAEVTCSYAMENAWSRALGVGPFTGSSFEFVIADGQIQRVTHDFDFSEYGPEVFRVFMDWVGDAYPGDVEIMLTLLPNGNGVRSTTPEALALWEQHTAEFVSSLNPSFNEYGIDWSAAQRSGPTATASGRDCSAGDLWLAGCPR